MSDESIEIMAHFESAESRDRAYRYLDHQGSVFEDEVPPEERALWKLLQEELPAPDNVQRVDQRTLRVEYVPIPDQLDDEGLRIPQDDVADRIYEHLIRAGMTEAYVLAGYEGQVAFALLRPIPQRTDFFWRLQCKLFSWDPTKPEWRMKWLYDSSDSDGTPSSVWPQVLEDAFENDEQDMLALMIELYESTQTTQHQPKQPAPR